MFSLRQLSGRPGGSTLDGLLWMDRGLGHKLKLILDLVRRRNMSSSTFNPQQSWVESRIGVYRLNRGISFSQLIHLVLITLVFEMEELLGLRRCSMSDTSQAAEGAGLSGGIAMTEGEILIFVQGGAVKSGEVLSRFRLVGSVALLLFIPQVISCRLLNVAELVFPMRQAVAVDQLVTAGFHLYFGTSRSLFYSFCSSPLQ